MKTRAITFTAREQAELLEQPEPPPLEAGCLRGETLVSLMSPGTELNAGYCGHSFPRSSGYANVFRVTEAAGDVGDWQVGDLGFGLANHTSQVTLPATAPVKVPPGLPPEHAVIARLMGVSMSTLVTTTARPGDPVLVMGGGPVGYLAAAQFTHAAYRVTLVEPLDARRELLAGMGVCEVLPALPDDAEPFALAIDCSGHEDAVIAACQAVRQRGEVVLVGVPWKQRSQAPAFAVLHAVFHQYAVLRSGWEWELPREPGHFQPHSIRGSFETALRWLADGHLPLTGLIRERDPADCQQAYQDHLQRRAAELFTVFRWAS